MTTILGLAGLLIAGLGIFHSAQVIAYALSAQRVIDTRLEEYARRD